MRLLASSSLTCDKDRALVANWANQAALRERRRATRTLADGAEGLGSARLKPREVRSSNGIKALAKSEPPAVDRAFGIRELGLRPGLELCGIKPKPEEAVVEAPPEGERLRELRRQADLLRRYFAVADRAAEWVGAEHTSKNQRRCIRALAEIVGRSGFRRSQFPVRIAIHRHKLLDSSVWLTDRRSAASDSADRDRPCPQSMPPGGTMSN